MIGVISAYPKFRIFGKQDCITKLAFKCDAVPSIFGYLIETLAYGK
jgi:hypothetical protein